MELMARSGCRGLLIGLESISDASLGDVRKGFNDPPLYRTLISDLHAHGISIQGCFVFGNDHDTLDVFDETAQFAIDAAIDLPRFAIVTPFPGTPLHRRLEREGRILTQELGALRRPARRVPAEADDAAGAAGRPRARLAQRLLAIARSPAVSPRRARSCRSP